jgi:hypothetical protein
MELTEAEARSLESREKVTELTRLLLASRVQRHFPLLVSHNLMVSSTEPEARSLESREKAT